MRARIATVALAAIAALALLAAAPAQAAKPKRIVALTPFSANVLAELGIRPVAIGDGIGGRKELHPKLRGVKRIPLSHSSNGPSLEQITRLNPDLMLSERTWRAGHEAIRDQGIQVKETDPYSVGKIRSKVEEIGKTVGEKAKAKKIAGRIAKEIKSAKTKPKITSRPDTLLILGVGSERYVFLPSSWGGDVLRSAGANLLGRELESDGEDFLVSGGFAKVSNEEIISFNPEVIIAIPHGRAEDMPQQEENLKNDPTFAETNAGENDRLYVTLDNTLLQASTKTGKTIKQVRKQFLQNR